MILESALKDKRVREMLVSIFNDEIKENAEALAKEIQNISGIELLSHQPRVMNGRIDDSLAEKLEQISTIPTLYFLDPWGYKGLSLRLIKAVLKSPGCDCIFFFNYGRINAALSNPEMKQNMDSFFGAERAEKLRASLTGKPPKQREALIINELKIALKELGGTYSVEYFFKDASGSRTSYFLILTSKVPLAERIMKEIMSKESSIDERGLALFGYTPVDQSESQRSLFDTDPLDELGSMLLVEFSGRRLKVGDIYRRHSVGKRFTLHNYKDAIKKLEAAGKIQANPPAKKRMRSGKPTLSDKVVIIFPSVRTPNGN